MNITFKRESVKKPQKLRKCKDCPRMVVVTRYNGKTVRCISCANVFHAGSTVYRVVKKPPKGWLSRPAYAKMVTGKGSL